MLVLLKVALNSKLLLLTAFGILLIILCLLLSISILLQSMQIVSVKDLLLIRLYGALKKRRLLFFRVFMRCTSIVVCGQLLLLHSSCVNCIILQFST